MRYLAFLIFIVSSSDFSRFQFDKFAVTGNVAHAVAPAIALAAPAAAIGALELAAVSASAALAIGVITVAQNEEYQRVIGLKIAAIKDSTKEMLDSTIEDALAFAKSITEKNNVCKTVPQERKAHSVGCTQSPEACCQDFLSKFSNRVQKTRGGFRIFQNPNNNRAACCMEWDHVHGGFEIFDNRGNHLGERGCEDLSDDPCKNTLSRGKHALPSNKNHSPKSPLCKP